MLHNGSNSISNAQIAENPAVLEELLLGLTNPNQVAQATQALTAFLSDISSCVPLASRISNSENSTVKNLACVYLRSKIGAYAKKIGQDDIVQLQNLLLECLMRESDLQVLKSLAQLIITFSKKFAWHDELLNALMTIMGAGEQVRSEIALTICRNMVSITVGQPFDVYANVFRQGLTQGSERMQIESLKGFQQLGIAFGGDTEVMVNMREFYMLMAQKCQEFVKHPDENVSRYVVDMWDEMLTENCLIGSEGDIFEFMLDIGKRRDLPVNVRYQCSDYIKHYTKQFPNKMIKEGLLPKAMELCIGLLMENYEEKNEDAISNPLSLGIEILDCIFLNVRVDHTAEMAINGFQQLYSNGHTGSALALLAIMAEGCGEILKDPNYLGDLYKELERSMNNPDPEVRKVTYEALTQFVFHLSPEMNQFSDRLMPLIFQAMNNEKENLENLEAVCITLDSYCSALQEHITPHIENLFSTLIALLTTSVSNEVREAAISALSSTLMTTREIGVDYPKEQLVGEIGSMLLSIISNANADEQQKLKAEAVNCLGEVCLIIGAEMVYRWDQEVGFLKPIIENVAVTDCTELKEFTFGFFGTMAEVFKENLLDMPIFEPMFTIVTECLDNDDGLIEAEEDDGLGGGKAPNAMGNDDEEEDIDEDGLTQSRFYCATGFLEEKTAAAVAMEKFARNLGHRYQICWDVAVARVIDCMTYPHPSLKQQIIRAFHWHIKNILDCLTAGAVDNETNQQCGIEYVNMTMTLFLVNIAREDDKDCCVETIIALSLLMKDYAQQILGLNGQDPDPDNQGQSWEEFMEVVEMLFDEQVICQAPDDIELDQAKREVEDNLILDGLTELSVALTKGLNESQFVHFWTRIFQKLPRYLQKNRSHVEYSLAIGCMGDASANLSPESIAPFLTDSVQMALQGLQQSNHHLVRQNSVFALGCLFRAGQNGMQQYFQTIMEFLEPMLQLPREQDMKTNLMRDNAYSTLGSILAYMDISEDMFKQLFEIFLAGLPLQDDDQENKHVANAILRILQTKPALVQDKNTMVQSVLQDALMWKNMDKDILMQIGTVLGLDTSTLNLSTQI